MNQPMPGTDASPADGNLYPIRTVATLTGVNPVTLRAWERRYRLMSPRRTESGHRLYSARDIDRIREVVRLVEEGVPISRVDEALRLQGEAPVADSERHPDVWHGYREAMIAAVTGFDDDGLEAVYSEALSLYPIDVVTRRLLVPLLQELGERWAAAAGSIAEEHFFAMYMRNKLGARFHHRRRYAGAPRLLAACLPGEHHEIGLLLFALAAHDRGYDVVLLGADMPIEELAEVARRTRSRAVVLSGSVEPAPRLLVERIGELVAAASGPVFVGGRAAAHHAQAIKAAGAVPLADDIALGLRVIARHLDQSNSPAR